MRLREKYFQWWLFDVTVDGLLHKFHLFKSLEITKIAFVFIITFRASSLREGSSFRV